MFHVKSYSFVWFFFCYFQECFDWLVVIGSFSSKDYADWMKTILLGGVVHLHMLLAVNTVAFVLCIHTTQFTHERLKKKNSCLFARLGVPYLRRWNVRVEHIYVHISFTPHLDRWHEDDATGMQFLS